MWGSRVLLDLLHWFLFAPISGGTGDISISLGCLPPSFSITGTLVLPHFLPPLQKVIAHKADVQGMSLHATSPAWQLGDSRLSQAATIGCEWL